MTDEAGMYRRVGQEFASHDVVTHSKDEYVRYEGAKTIHTNTVEGFYSIFKRGMKGRLPALRRTAPAPLPC